jgi:glutaredoxin-related protein
MFTSHYLARFPLSYVLTVLKFSMSNLSYFLEFREHKDCFVSYKTFSICMLIYSCIPCIVVKLFFMYALQHYFTKTIPKTTALLKEYNLKNILNDYVLAGLS